MEAVIDNSGDFMTVENNQKLNLPILDEKIIKA
jgi:hypothetical protein